MSEQPIIGAVDGLPLALDLDRLVTTRMLLTANSGAGKSWALRRLLEQTHGHIQQLVIDPEGEFYTLRERFDYVLAGKGGDCPAEPRSAGLLARRLLELGTSAVLDLYELAPRDRVRFVSAFLGALIDAPRKLWHPALIVIDEAHTYAPEKGHGEAESLVAVGRLMAQGRKRGFAGILASQRLAKLAKDVAAEANNVMVGRIALDTDLRRAGDLLGLAKSDWPRLRSLLPGHFFAFGPALGGGEVVEVAVGTVATSHPKAGAGAAPPAPPRETVQRVLAQLADLPREAEEEARTAAELRQQVASLKRQLADAQDAQPSAPEPIIERIEISVVPPEVAAELTRTGELIAEAGEAAAAAGRDLEARIAEIRPLLDRLAAPSAAPPARPVRVALPRPSPAVVARPERFQAPRQTPADLDGNISGPEQRILDALAWLESIGVERADNAAAAFLAGYSHRGGAYLNPRGRLRSRGLVDYLGGQLALTAEGRALAACPDAPLTTEELHRRILERLPNPEQRILRPLLDAYPESLPSEELARQAGYEPGGGAFLNPRGRLRTLGLIEYPSPGLAAARSILFLEAA